MVDIYLAEQRHGKYPLIRSLTLRRINVLKRNVFELGINYNS